MHEPRAAELKLRANVPTGGDAEKKARDELAGYYAHLEATDRAIGRLLSEVDLSGTIVVFTSVHGDMHGAHGLFRKGWPHEESVRVPLVVRVPGEAAARSEAPVSLLDLRGLTLGWAGVRPMPVLPRAAAISMPSVVRLPDQCDRTWRGLRTATRKLVWTDSGETWLDFDLERDPLEQVNLARDPSRQDEIRRLRAEAGL